MDLKNKVSLVTGAGQGIGEGIAKVLASHGSKVMIVDLNRKSAEEVAKEINSLFPHSAAFFEADLRWLKHYGFVPIDVPGLAGGLSNKSLTTLTSAS